MTEVEKLREEFEEFKASLLTADQYLRYERLPQLVGGNVTHFAGSEEVAVVGDRWEYVDPQYDGTAGNGYRFLTVSGGATSATVLDVTEEGKLLSIGMACSLSDLSNWIASTSIDADLRITIDGGTPTDLKFSDGGTAWDPWAWPWRSHGVIPGTGATSWGVNAGDAFALPLNFEYKTSLKIELIVNSAVDLISGDYVIWSCYTHRARLTST